MDATENAGIALGRLNQAWINLPRPQKTILKQRLILSAAVRLARLCGSYEDDAAFEYSLIGVPCPTAADGPKTSPTAGLAVAIFEELQAWLKGFRRPDDLLHFEDGLHAKLVQLGMLGPNSLSSWDQARDPSLWKRIERVNATYSVERVFDLWSPLLPERRHPVATPGAWLALPFLLERAGAGSQIAMLAILERSGELLTHVREKEDGSPASFGFVELGAAASKLLLSIEKLSNSYEKLPKSRAAKGQPRVSSRVSVVNQFDKCAQWVLVRQFFQVRELVELTGVSIQAVCKHLQRLKQADIITVAPEGDLGPMSQFTIWKQVSPWWM